MHIYSLVFCVKTSLPKWKHSNSLRKINFHIFGNILFSKEKNKKIEIKMLHTFNKLSSMLLS
jgi:hypothetical protein